MDSDSISFSPGCRILTVSFSSSPLVRELIHRVKVLANEANPSETDTPSGTAGVSGTLHIPWTISNKYYTAPVHFEIRELRDPLQWEVEQHAAGVPAIIYVWASGEPYKDHVQALSQHLARHDPDVALAVRLDSGTHINQNGDAAEDDDLEQFLTEHGFEFVDGRQGRLGQRAIDHPDDDSGAPGLYRVIDALSTIMWPSMVQSAGARKRRTVRLEDEFDGLHALISAHSPTMHSTAMQREVDELERWLEGGGDRNDGNLERAEDGGLYVEGDDPWGARSQQVTPPPRSQGRPLHALSSGFDDDFTDFVSASRPSLNEDQDEVLSSNDYHTYQSLDSVSDLNFESSEDEDDDLPTRSEISATSIRIFGSTNSQSPSLGASASTDSASFANAADDDSMAGFDMDRVLVALHGLKEEIADIPDEKERRQAAARAALGLVYGLRGEVS